MMYNIITYAPGIRLSVYKVYYKINIDVQYNMQSGTIFFVGPLVFTTRVKNSTVNDQLKLKIVVKLIKKLKKNI